MQLQTYVLQVNDQLLDHVVGFDEYAIVQFINQQIQAEQDNKLIFYRTIKWLAEDNQTVLKEDKEVIMETIVREQVTIFHYIIHKIEEWKENLLYLQRTLFNSRQLLNPNK